MLSLNLLSLTSKEFVDLLNLSSGQKVLDVGCGIGGGDFYMAKVRTTIFNAISVLVASLLSIYVIFFWCFTDIWCGSSWHGFVIKYDRNCNGESQ